MFIKYGEIICKDYSSKTFTYMLKVLPMFGVMLEYEKQYSA